MTATLDSALPQFRRWCFFHTSIRTKLAIFCLGLFTCGLWFQFQEALQLLNFLKFTNENGAHSAADEEGTSNVTMLAPKVISSSFDLMVAKSPKELMSTNSSVASLQALKSPPPSYLPPHVFYNVFLPATKEGQTNALRIVKEQLDQIKDSYAYRVLAEEHKHNMTLSFLTIGASEVLTPQLMQSHDFCGALTWVSCFHLEHVGAGWEVLTLTHLHQYCTRHVENSAKELLSAPPSRVVYIHNKGSLHQYPVTENWRRSLTEVAFSELCLGGHNDAPGNQCNVCGATFYTAWTLFFPGNMFTATCNYVHKLIPPSNFSARMEEAIELFVELRLRGQMLTKYVRGNDDRIDFFGLDRFSDEHWIASHPDVRPCDCNDYGNVYQFNRGRVPLKNMKWSMAPRVHGTPHDELDDIYKTLTRADALEWRLREYYLLPGNLLKWHSLYHQAPPDDSWAWTWFPDGPLWKQAIKEHGSNAFHMINSRHINTELSKDFIFTRVIRNKNVALQRSYFTTYPSESTAIFYHLYIPKNSTQVYLDQTMDLVSQQMDIIANSMHVKQQLYYVTMGHAELNNSNLCSQPSNMMDCYHLAHHDKHYRGETLRHVYNFCRQHPAQRVVYLQNQIPFGASQTLNAEQCRLLILHGTMAATNDQCLTAMQNASDSSCNLCGLMFFTLPAFAMSPGSWAANCSYINGLLPPKIFVDRMQDFIRKVLIEKLKGRVSFSIVKEQPDHLGLDGFAMDHWVGSHPSLLPCDLSDSRNGISHWVSSKVSGALRPASDFKLTHGVHHNLGSSYDSSPEKESEVRNSAIMRSREYYFLAGNLMKWYALYGKVPPVSSDWVWSTFPDKAKWLEGVKLYGSQVVQSLNEAAS